REIVAATDIASKSARRPRMPRRGGRRRRLRDGLARPPGGMGEAIGSSRMICEWPDSVAYILVCPRLGLDVVVALLGGDANAAHAADGSLWYGPAPAHERAWDDDRAGR